MKEKQSRVTSEEKEKVSLCIFLLEGVGKDDSICYARIFILPCHNPGNIPGTGWHEPGEAVAPAGVCEWNKEGQGCEGRAATPLDKTR